MTADQLTGSVLHPGAPGSRVALIRERDTTAAARVEHLLAPAAEGLGSAYLPTHGTFAQTVRGVPGHPEVRLRREGSNLRYAAIAALGLARLTRADQLRLLHGRTVEDLARLVGDRAADDADAGVVALAVWVTAEVTGEVSPELLTRSRALVADETPLSTVALAWLLTAAVVASPLADTDSLVTAAAARLRRHEGTGGLYPHHAPPTLEPWWRRHVGSFADSIYPVQALARAGRLTGEPDLVEAANRTAHRLCALQGPAGQWWWHYDARHGSVVERYPVYSVHQHSMAPMALLDLLEAGGDDHRDAIVLGLSWLDRHPEVVEELISPRHSLVWRKVGRREPRKAARGLGALGTALHPGWRTPGLDRVLPPVQVDHECRPYELGWLLHAWLPTTTRESADDRDPA